jgi:tetratricopeptide (TPR) repeat protein
MKPVVGRNLPRYRELRLFLLGSMVVYCVALAKPTPAAASSEGVLESIGKVRTVLVEGKTHASYELYLPLSYTPAQSNAPLIFAFSPTGNGTSLVNRLKVPCEAAGWVIVGCNRIRNGYDPMDRLMEWEILCDVRRRIPHDRQREYLAGFSGGAMRAYGMTRAFWDEFAGVIALAGWLGVYDPELVYPSRLAVAMLDGTKEPLGLATGESDRRILSRFQIRAKHFPFPGGHEMAPAPVIDEAVRWLEADWQAHQRARMYSSTNASTALLEKAELAYEQGRHDTALAGLVELVLQFAFTPAAVTADQKIAQILGEETGRRMALRTPALVTYPEAIKILLARAENRDGFPSADRIARCELAFIFNQENSLAIAQLAEALASSDEPKLRDLARAEKLAEYATNLEPHSWYAWSTRATVAAELGRRELARQYQETAMDLAPGNLKLRNLNKLHRLRS